jgi:homocysteine S-methyltransferase
MNSLHDRLTSSQDVLLLGGCVSTRLESQGKSIDGPLWGCRMLYEDPEAIYRVHRDYLNAGADIINTCSYQGTVEGFMKNGFSRERSEELLKSSVSLAKRAIADHMAEQKQQNIVSSSKPLVALSLGSYGATLANGAEYRGNFERTLEQLMEFHANRLKVLLQTEPDILLFETIPCKLEAEAICNLLKSVPFNIQTILSFCCRNDREVNQGESFAIDCVPLVNDVQAIVCVGVNCTSPLYVEELLRSARKKTNKYLVCYPHSGENWTTEHRWTENPEMKSKGGWGNMALQWHQAGARIVGGCCRVYPEDIYTLSSQANMKQER